MVVLRKISTLDDSFYYLQASRNTKVLYGINESVTDSISMVDVNQPVTIDERYLKPICTMTTGSSDEVRNILKRKRIGGEVQDEGTECTSRHFSKSREHSFPIFNFRNISKGPKMEDRGLDFTIDLQEIKRMVSE